VRRRKPIHHAALAILAIGICAGGSPAIAAAHRTEPAFVQHGFNARAYRAAHRTCANTNLIPTSNNRNKIRAAVLCLVNRERGRRGESPLRTNMRLQRAAESHSISMAFDGYFAHVGPRGQTPLARMRASGYIHGAHAAYVVGENIAWGTLYLASPRAIVSAWIASPEHRANILDRSYRETAIGICAHMPSALGHGQPGAIYTQDFGAVTEY
jgi:uncharacterized protein YkwD